MALRVTLFVLIGLLAGCRVLPTASDGDSSAYDTAQPAPVNPLEHNTPAQLPRPDAVSHVRPVVHIQPAPAIPMPESVAPAPPSAYDGSPKPSVNRAQGLTLDELEQMALANNPSLSAANARVEAARGNWVQAGLPPNTILGYSGQQLFSGGAAEQQGLYLEQVFIRGDKLELSRAVAARAIQTAQQQWAQQRQRVLTDVRLAYYSVLIAQRRMEMTQQLMQIAQEALATAEALANAKEVSQVDVIRARVELQSGELMLKGARNQLAAAWSQLAAVVAMPDIMPRPLSGDLTPPATRIDFDSTLRQLLAESPEMSAALSEVERARWAVERAYAEPVPDVDVQAVVQSDNGTGGSNANLQVTLPIPWLNRNQGGIQQAHAQLVAAERAVGVTELSLHQRLASVYQQYETARNQVEDYLKNDGILANTKASLDLVHQGYQNGESGYLELLTAQRTHFQTNLAYVEALGDLFSSVIQMEGMLLSGSLQE